MIGGEKGKVRREPEPLFPGRELFQGFFPGNVEDLEAEPGEPRGHLEAERRFAYPGIAAEEDGGPYRHAAAQDTVHFSYARRDPLFVGKLFIGKNDGPAWFLAIRP